MIQECVHRQELDGFRNQMTWCERYARGVQNLRLTLQGLILHYLILTPNAKNRDVTFREWSTSRSVGLNIKKCTTPNEFCKQHFNRLRTTVNYTRHQLQLLNFVQPAHTYVPYYSPWKQHWKILLYITDPVASLRDDNWNDTAQYKYTLFMAVSWRWRVVAGLSPRRPAFDLGLVYVGFVVKKVALQQVSRRL
jgi:hypothetical protein